MTNKSIQALGGKARAKSLTAEQRSEQASNAAAVRWGIPRATHDGKIVLGDKTIECAVLEDGTRVLSRIGFIRAIGRKGKAKGGRQYDEEFKTPVFLTAENLKRFVTKELIENSTPIPYKPLKGGQAIGYKAELLPLVCQVFIDAKFDGKLLPIQDHIAQECKILQKGFMILGITALVDEATGYQEVRDSMALRAILEKYITGEWAKWSKTFPDEFYREMLRLKGIALPLESGSKKPSYIGHWTNDIVYSRLAPGVLPELRKVNPTLQTGGRKRKHFQHLTVDVGNPALKEHLTKVIFLMRAFHDGQWDEFKRSLDRASQKFGDTIPLDV